MSHDAFLLVSFGGPEGPDDVLPFLENVLRGRNVPRERLLAVAEHYYHFGGISPINAQNRALLAALKDEFAAAQINLPLYLGNRNWHPLLTDTLRQMKADGVRRALAFFTSTFSSYSGCRQYLENIAAAQAAVGEGAPVIDKLPNFHNHPGYIEPMIERTRSALAQIPAARRAAAHLLFTAHSIPLAMSQSCDYESQFRESSRLVAKALNHSNWRIVYQSRSGPPTQPWLTPDINDALHEIAGDTRDVVAVPIGFLSDHIEVLYDLDHEAAQTAASLNLNFHRAPTIGAHPRFIHLIRDLVEEGLKHGSKPCPPDCCPSGRVGQGSAATAGPPIPNPKSQIPNPKSEI